MAGFTESRIKEGTPTEQPTLNPSDPATLISALGNDNLFWRLHAQRLLVERGNLDVVPELAALVRETSTDALGLNPAAIHALWTMKGLNAFEKSDEASGCRHFRSNASLKQRPARRLDGIAQGKHRWMTLS